MLTKFNEWLAIKITDAVGTMWCAYVFAALALVSLPDAIKGGKSTLIAWIAQTFLQLVLLSIILVGQKVQAMATAQVEAAVKEHHKIVTEIHRHFGLHLKEPHAEDHSS